VRCHDRALLDAYREALSHLGAAERAVIELAGLVVDDAPPAYGRGRLLAAPPPLLPPSLPPRHQPLKWVAFAAGLSTRTILRRAKRAGAAQRQGGRWLIDSRNDAVMRPRYSRTS
jgi:hypothetical protein